MKMCIFIRGNVPAGNSWVNAQYTRLRDWLDTSGYKTISGLARTYTTLLRFADGILYVRRTDKWRVAGQWLINGARRTAMTAWYISRADPRVELARRPVNCQYGTSRATWPDDDTTWCTLSNVQLMYSLTLRDLRTYFSATKHHRDSLAYLYVKRRPDVHVCQKSFDTQSQSLMFQTA